MGFFSWMTKDTNESIPNVCSDRDPFTVHMVLPNGKVYTEESYEGYGVFGGKDYFEALAEINGLESDREAGIHLLYHGQPKVYPQLVEDPSTVKDFSTVNEDCPHQGYFYPSEDEDEEEKW